MIHEAPEGFYITVDGRKFGFWRSRAEASAALQVELRRAAARQPETISKRDESVDFAIGLTTGIPMSSAQGIIGAAIHNSFTAPVDSTPSCDTSSSSTFDSGSCSSFDGGTSF